MHIKITLNFISNNHVCVKKSKNRFLNLTRINVKNCKGILEEKFAPYPVMEKMTFA